jgi:hypothetical protein
MLREKPSYFLLHRILENLAVAPTAWNGDSTKVPEADVVAIHQFLLSIISSDLAWLNEKDPENEKLEDQKDELWELASKRLAERCGRSGEFPRAEISIILVNTAQYSNA